MKPKPSREHSFGIIGAARGGKMLQRSEMNERWSVDLLKGKPARSSSVLPLVLTMLLAVHGVHSSQARYFLLTASKG